MESASAVMGEDFQFVTCKSTSPSAFTLRVGKGEEHYKCKLGVGHHIGIFQEADVMSFSKGLDTRLGLDQLEMIFSSPYLHLSRVADFIHQCLDTDSDFYKCLQGLILADSIYGGLMSATVNLNVLKANFSQSAFVRNSQRVCLEESGGSSGRTGTADSRSDKLIKCQPELSFSCIALFESGSFDLDQASLRGVMALSAGDSTFVSEALLSDPSVTSKHCSIRRVFGNLGRSEMAFLVPPATPILRQSDPSWHLINHHPFDGEFEDFFSGTSLHLSFTDYEMSLDVGTRGLRDRQALLLESLVSANDRGEHIGDLDVLAMFTTTSLHVAKACTHLRDGNDKDLDSGNIKQDFEGKLVSLDCWDEFFDLPMVTGIVRAKGNWQARLTAAAASIQMQRKVCVLPIDTCMECLREILAGPEHFDVIIA